MKRSFLESMLLKQPLVGIVVLNFNGEDCLEACLFSLTKLDYSRTVILVVDNASTDNSFEKARKRFPQFEFLQNKENLGFAGGMNVGIRQTLARGAEWVWILNNDAVAEESALTRLMWTAQERPDAGLLSPYILSYPEKSLWFGKGKINRLRMRVEHGEPSLVEKKLSYHESEFLTGCALLIKKEVTEAIGILDERYFLYYEDVDYSRRARNSGFSLLAVPKARVYHRERSNLSTEKLYYLVYSGLVFFRRHASGWYTPYFWLYVTIRRIKNALDMALGMEKAYIVRRAYDDYFHVHSPSYFSRFRQLP